MKVAALKNTLSEVYERKTRCDLERALTLLTIIGIVALAVIGGLSLGEIIKLGQTGSYACLAGGGLIVLGLAIYTCWKSKLSVTKKTDLTRSESFVRAHEVEPDATVNSQEWMHLKTGVFLARRASDATYVYCTPTMSHPRPVPNEGVPVLERQVPLNDCLNNPEFEAFDPALRGIKLEDIVNESLNDPEFVASRGSSLEKPHFEDVLKFGITQALKGKKEIPNVAWHALYLAITVVKTTSGKWFYMYDDDRDDSGLYPLPPNGVKIPTGGSIDKYGRIVGERAIFIRF